MAKYITRAVATPIPPSQPLTPAQVRNPAGGYSWKVDKWVQLDRWLTLGSMGGTFYVGEVDLTKENVQSVRDCIAEDPHRVAAETILSLGNHTAAKPDTALYTLALLLKTSTNVDARRSAAIAISGMANVRLTGYQILRLADFVQSLGGWGRLTKQAFANWFNSKSPRDLAYQAVKYQQREGWKMADLLRLCHPYPVNDIYNAIFKWVVDGEYKDFQRIVPELDPIWGYRALRETMEGNKPNVDNRSFAATIRQFRTPREAVPTEMLSDAIIWEALLDDMPMVATIRNLATLTRLEVLKPYSPRMVEVAATLGDAKTVLRSHVHPIQILSALTTYSAGKGVRGKHTWQPQHQIEDALNAAFYHAFGNVVTSGKKILLGIDVSGSMQGQNVNGIPNLPAHKAAAAMGLVLMNTEPLVLTITFDTDARMFDMSPRQRIDDVFAKLNKIRGGGTDMAQTVQYALDHHLDVDAFVILTDNMSWAGGRHTMDVLNDYRHSVGHPVKLVSVQMTADAYTNADPGDPDVLECVGFNTTTPLVISNFLRGHPVDTTPTDDDTDEVE